MQAVDDVDAALTNAGFEIRCMWDQFLILKTPKSCVKLTDIQNSV